MTYEIIDARPVRRDTAKIALCKTGHELRGDYFKTFDQAVDHYRERCRQHRCK